MNANELHAELVATCGHIVKHYRDDLEKHDRDWILDHPGHPFLHFSRECGTHLVCLWHRDELPARGHVVPYYFGTAGAEQIASQIADHVKCIIGQETTQLCLHYDGRRLRKVSAEKAIDIAREHQRRLMDEIHNPRRQPA